MKDYTLRIILAFTLLLILIITIFFNNQFHIPEYLRTIGFIICTIGVIFIIAGIITLGEYFTTSIIPKGLVTTGIYSKIRHPMFTGAILVYIGIVVIFQSIIGFLLVIFILIPFFIYSAIEEEKILSEKFKDKYTAYKKKTFF
jgi:protein-S-isoprenylcysteine O-methyltransferase Ste14